MAASCATVAATVPEAKGRAPAVRAQAVPHAEVADRCPVPAQLGAAFRAAARDTDLPIALLVAVAHVESNVTVDARSPAGARGVLQVLPSTGASLGLDVDRPDTNVLAGARYLRLLLDRFKSPDLALAAYNAGPTTVDVHGGAPTAATLTYVANVTALWRELRDCR